MCVRFPLVKYNIDLEYYDRMSQIIPRFFFLSVFLGFTFGLVFLHIRALLEMEMVYHLFFLAKTPNIQRHDGLNG